MKTKNPLLLASILGVFCLASLHSHADVLMSTDFSGRTISGDTANDITYTLNGVQDPGSLTAIEAAPGDNQLDGLFNTTEAGGHFAPQLNTDTEDNWSVTIPFDLTVSGIRIDDVVLDGTMFNGSGEYQNKDRDTEFLVSIVGSTSGTIGSQTLTAQNDSSTAAENDSSLATLSDAAWTSPLTYTFPSDGTLTLTNAESWDLVIETVNFAGVGNNTGLTSFTVNGAVIPEPSTIALFGLAGMALILGSRRRRK